MFAFRAKRLGSLCVRSSFDPGSGGTRRTRVPWNPNNELPSRLAVSVRSCWIVTRSLGL